MTLSHMETELTKRELRFIKRELGFVFENNFFKGDWGEFKQYSNWKKDRFDKNLKILNSIRRKLNTESIYLPKPKVLGIRKTRFI